MSSIKLKHASGNGVIISAPSSNPAADRTLTLPSDADGVIAKTDSSGNLTVAGDLTVDTDTLKVDSSNNRVAIGHTSPATNLDVKTAHASNEANFYVRNNTVNYKVRTLSDQVQAGTETNHPFYAVSNNQYVARFDGDGIKFGSDTAAANALNDYEEGYWSPTGLDGMSVTLNGTGTHASRRYIKIGKQVHAYFDFTFGNLFNTFGARFGGLPFAAASGSGTGHAAAAIGYTTKGQEAFIHVSGLYPAIFNSSGTQFTMNQVSSNRFAGVVIYTTD